MTITEDEEKEHAYIKIRVSELYDLWGNEINNEATLYKIGRSWTFSEAPTISFGSYDPVNKEIELLSRDFFHSTTEGAISVHHFRFFDLNDNVVPISIQSATYMVGPGEFYPVTVKLKLNEGLENKGVLLLELVDDDGQELVCAQGIPFNTNSRFYLKGDTRRVIAVFNNGVRLNDIHEVFGFNYSYDDTFESPNSNELKFKVDNPFNFRLYAQDGEDLKNYFRLRNLVLDNEGGRYYRPTTGFVKHAIYDLEENCIIFTVEPGNLNEGLIFSGIFNTWGFGSNQQTLPIIYKKGFGWNAPLP